MFVQPIMLLPYIMFSTWMGLFCDAASRPIEGGKRVPDPLARSGARSVSHAALDYWATPLGLPTESVSARAATPLATISAAAVERLAGAPFPAAV